MICANPDVTVARGERIIPCAGAIAALYEELGGRVIYAGKPYLPVYERAFEMIAAARGRPVSREATFCDRRRHQHRYKGRDGGRYSPGLRRKPRAYARAADARRPRARHGSAAGPSNGGDGGTGLVEAARPAEYRRTRKTRHLRQDVAKLVVLYVESGGLNIPRPNAIRPWRRATSWSRARLRAVRVTCNRSARTSSTTWTRR